MPLWSKLFGSGDPKLVVRVSEDVIIVTIPGTGFAVTYERTNGGLVATDSRGRKNEKAKLTMSEFLFQAWKAANEKARDMDPVRS
jgi:hypothetical protein